MKLKVGVFGSVLARARVAQGSQTCTRARRSVALVCLSALVGVLVTSVTQAAPAAASTVIYTLKFQYGPDHTATGGGGDRTSAHLYIDTVSLGRVGPSNPESGNDGIREWTEFSMDITAYFDPVTTQYIKLDRQDDFYFGFSDKDTFHMRRFRVEGSDGSIYYGGFNATAYTAGTYDGSPVGAQYSEIGSSTWGGSSPAGNDGQYDGEGIRSNTTPNVSNGLRFYIAAVTYSLKFDLGPDNTATGGSGHTSTIQMWIDGMSLGTFTSLPESGNDGIREWLSFNVEVTPYFDPTSSHVWWKYVSGLDKGRIRRFRVHASTGSVEYGEFPQGWKYTQQHQDGAGGFDYIGTDGAGDASQYDVEQDQLVNSGEFVDFWFSFGVRQAQSRGWWRHGWSTSVRRADPVDTASGAFVYGVADLSVSAPGVPFGLARTYNSNDPVIGSLGKGWSHDSAASLTVDPDGSVVVRTEDGAELVFTPIVGGGFKRPPAVTSSLAAVAGGYELTRADQVRYRFNTAGRLLSVKDRSGKGVDLSYDASNRLATATDAAGRVFTFAYNATGKLASVTAPAGDGRTVTFGYTGDLLTSMTDVRGGTTSYAYDASGRLNQITDPEGKLEVRNTYDANGRVIEQLDPLGNATTFTWNAATQTSTMTDPRGKTWVDTYANNVLVSSTEPNGTSNVSWDGALNPVRSTDARGNTWTASYDARGNLLSRTAPAPLSYIESWTYDANNNPLTHVDGRGNTTTYTYDGSGRLVTTSWPGGATETRTYNAAGQLATLTDARTNTTTYAYDTAGNLTSVSSPGGSVTSWTYDAAGRPLTRTEPRGNAPGATPADYRTTWTYDAAGNVLTETDALGRTTTSTYSGTGKVLTRTDPLSRVTTFAYNDADELVTETAPGGLVTTNDYDSRGQLTSVTSPSGAVTTYTYDDAGRAATMVEPRGNVPGATPADYRWAYGYDASGNQTTITDPLGNVTTQTFDALNRLTSITDPNAHTTTYGYDANSNRTSQANHLNHTTTWTYDARNRVSSMTNPLGKTWTYTYDANGNVTAETTPLGSVTTRTYDADNRLTAVVDPLGNVPGGVPADHEPPWV